MEFPRTAPDTSNRGVRLPEYRRADAAAGRRRDPPRRQPAALRGLADETFQLVYVDPPFNTGRTQKLVVLETTRDPGGDRVGFGGRTYASRLLAESSYRDSFDDYLGFLAPRLAEARRLLTRSGTLYLHVDHREAHLPQPLLDELFGREAP